MRTSGIGGAARDHLVRSGGKLVCITAQQRELHAKRERETHQRDVTNPPRQSGRRVVGLSRRDEIAGERAQRRAVPQVVPAGQHRAALGRHPVDLGEFQLDLAHRAELDRRVQAPEVTPHRRHRPVDGSSELDSATTQLEPLGDRVRHGDREMAGRDRLEDRGRVAGQLGLSECVGSQLSRARAAFGLGHGDRTLRQQPRTQGMVVLSKQVESARADRHDLLQHRAITAAVNHQACRSEQVGPGGRFGQRRGLHAEPCGGLGVTVEVHCVGELDQQLRELVISRLGSACARHGELCVADGIVVSQRRACRFRGQPCPGQASRELAGPVPVRGDRPRRGRCARLKRGGCTAVQLRALVRT